MIKKLHLNIFLQIVALILIFKIFIYDDNIGNKFELLSSFNVIYIFLFLTIVKLLITYLFLKILNIITNNKNSYLNIIDIHLKGGLINQLLPGLGFIFRYYQFKINSNISLVQYTSTQTIWSIYSLLSYLLLAFIFGFIMFIGFSFLSTFIIIVSLISLVIFIVLFKNQIFLMLKHFFLRFKKITFLYSEILKIKNIVKVNILPMFFIYFIFIILGLIECSVFFLSMKIFGLEISIISAFYIWISSTIITALALINFIGLFEIIVAISSSFIIPDFNYMIIFGINLRIVNLISTIFIISITSIMRFTKNRFY